MEKDDLIKYWIETSNQDYKTMINLFKSKDYSWCLFIGHLVIEKLLKAMYVKNVSENSPRIHNLLQLSDSSLIETNEHQKDALDLITTFNIQVRYPDYKLNFYNKCNYEFTKRNVEIIKELRIWLLSLIEME